MSTLRYCEMPFRDTGPGVRGERFGTILDAHDVARQVMTILTTLCQQ